MPQVRLQRPRFVAAALTIQRIWRSHHGRRSVQKRLEACVTLQRVWRGHQV